MASTLATRLVLDALDMALAMRRPNGVIHHSEQARGHLYEGPMPTAARRAAAFGTMDNARALPSYPQRQQPQLTSQG
jgi:hypothetical protein